jgi:hypothetical protein
LVRAGFFGAHQVVRGRAIPSVRAILARTIVYYVAVIFFLGNATF